MDFKLKKIKKDLVNEIFDMFFVHKVHMKKAFMVLWKGSYRTHL